jgi:hypothetical protein
LASRMEIRKIVGIFFEYIPAISNSDEINAWI